MSCIKTNIFRPGALCPVQATDAMTEPVGQRDGQLYVAPTGGVPDVTETDNGKIATVLEGAWAVSDFYPAKIRSIEGSILSIQGDLSYQQGIIDEIYSGIQQMSRTLNAINREVI